MLPDTSRCGSTVRKGRGARSRPPGSVPDVTLACGDDHFGEHEATALATLLGWLEELEPEVLICGPSFGSGRYGYACGVLAREAGRRGSRWSRR